MRCAVYKVLLVVMMMITAHRQTHTHTDTEKRKQYIRQFHSVHLADIITIIGYRTMQHVGLTSHCLPLSLWQDVSGAETERSGPKLGWSEAER